MTSQPEVRQASIEELKDIVVMERIPRASDRQLLLAAGECQELIDWFPGSIVEALARRWLDEMESEFEKRKENLRRFREERGLAS